MSGRRHQHREHWHCWLLLAALKAQSVLFSHPIHVSSAQPIAQPLTKGLELLKRHPDDTFGALNWCSRMPGLAQASAVASATSLNTKPSGFGAAARPEAPAKASPPAQHQQASKPARSAASSRSQLPGACHDQAAATAGPEPHRKSSSHRPVPQGGEWWLPAPGFWLRRQPWPSPCMSGWPFKA